MAIARVQSKATDTVASVTATSLTITLDNPTTSGNVVIVGIATTGLRGLIVTSTHGIFSNVTPSVFDGTTTNEFVYIFYGVMFGADTVITIQSSDLLTTFAATSAVAVEYSGAGIQPDNIPAPINVGTTNSANTGNLANTTANALYVGIIGVKTQSSTENTSWATNNVAPFSIVAQTTTNNNGSATIDRAIVYLDAIVSTSAGRVANVNHGFGAKRYAGLLATFKQFTAAGGGGLRAAGHGGLAA